MIGAPLLDPHHRVRGKPVVGVHHVEVADIVLGLKEMPDERPAHFLDFLHKHAVQIEGTVMITDAVDLVHPAGPVAGPGEDMHFMPASLQCRRQFRHVGGYPTHSVGVQRFP
jgi:hypothetical protein